MLLEFLIILWVIFILCTVCAIIYTVKLYFETFEKKIWIIVLIQLTILGVQVINLYYVL